MTPDFINQLTVGLLMLTLASVLLMGLVLTIFVVCYSRRVRSLSVAPRPKKRISESILLPKYGTAVFEGPTRWFAIRSSNVAAVQSSLGLHNATPRSWDEGMAKLAEHSLFIAPPFRGWILVVGQAVPDPAEDVDECFRFILRLSRALGHVQFFSVNRALNHHAWVRADEGKIRRAYAWAGETLWNQGAITQAETDLKLRCFNYGETPQPVMFSGDSFHSNADKVAFLAARWSFDPATIDTAAFPAQFGVAGDLAHTRQS